MAALVLESGIMNLRLFLLTDCNIELRKLYSGMITFTELID